MTRPSYDELVQASSRLQNEADAAAMKVGDCSAVLWRKVVSDDWIEAVIERTALDSFTIWSKDGLKECDTFTHGRDEDGAPYDDSVQEEWNMTIRSTLVTSTLNVDEPLPDILAGAASESVTAPSAVKACVLRIMGAVLSRFANDDPRAPKPLPPLPLHETMPSGPSTSFHLSGTGGTATTDGSTAAQELGAVKSRCLVSGHPAFVWSVTDEMVGVVFDDPKVPWEAFSKAEFKALASPIVDPLAEGQHSRVGGVLMQRLSAGGAA
eukprot:3809944-Pleurochrysis_carterae.AAC.1